MTLALVDGTKWERPVAVPDGYGYYVEATEDPCDECDDGGDFYWPAGNYGPRPPCSQCRGTRKLHVTHEGCPWRSCEPTDEDAVEFYRLEVVEKEGVADAA